MVVLAHERGRLETDRAITESCALRASRDYADVLGHCVYPPRVSGCSAVAFRCERLNPLTTYQRWRFRCAGRHVVKPNQVNIISAAVFCDLQQVFHAVEARFASKLLGDVVESDLRY